MYISSNTYIQRFVTLLSRKNGKKLPIGFHVDNFNLKKKDSFGDQKKLVLETFQSQRNIANIFHIHLLLHIRLSCRQ